MLRRRRSFLLIGLIAALILTPLMVQAQGEGIPPLTETFTVADFDLDFQYPADWVVFGQDDHSVLFQVPIAGTGVPNAEGFAVEGGAMIAHWDFQGSGASAEEAAVAAAEDFLGAEETMFELSQPQQLDINGRTVVQVDIASIVFIERYISMEIDDDIVVTVWLSGAEEQIVRATSITLEMLATVRESGTPLPESSPVVTPALTQDHTRQADQTSFSAPANWIIEETDNFTLLTAPNGVTVGISSEVIPGLDDIVLDTIALISDNLVRQLPGVELNEVEEFEVSSRRAARVTGVDGSGMYFGFWALDLGDGVVGHVSVIGPPEDVAELESTLFAIVETITSGQVAEGGEPVGALTLSESITSEDGTFTLNYPAEWSVQATDKLVVFTSGSVDLEDSDFQAVELLVVVEYGLDLLVQGAGITVPEIADPATIARVIVTTAEESGYPKSLEKLTVDGRLASLVYGEEGNQERYILIFTLPDGALANITAIAPLGLVEPWLDVLVAIAASMTPS